MNNLKGYNNLVINAGELVTCILFQGCIKIKNNVELIDVSVTQPLTVGNFVELDMHYESTYDYKKHSMPIVCGNIPQSQERMGLIISSPRWVDIPDNDLCDWGNMLKGRYYQITVIELFKSIFVSASNRYILVEDYNKHHKNI